LLFEQLWNHKLLLYNLPIIVQWHCNVWNLNHVMLIKHLKTFRPITYMAVISLHHGWSVSAISRSTAGVHTNSPQTVIKAASNTSKQHTESILGVTILTLRPYHKKYFNTTWTDCRNQLSNKHKNSWLQEFNCNSLISLLSWYYGCELINCDR
jgi:hypothetical protein